MDQFKVQRWVQTRVRADRRATEHQRYRTEALLRLDDLRDEQLIRFGWP